MRETTTRTSFLPSQVDWSGWGDLFVDVARWRPVVERICRTTAVASATHIEAGYPGTCAVFVVDGQVVVKLFPPMLWSDFEREREVYGVLNGRLAVLPGFLGSGVYRDQVDWPYLLIAYRPGVPIREMYGALTAVAKQNLGQQVGHIIRTIHNTPLSDLTHFDASLSGWHTFLRQRQEQCLTDIAQRTALSQTLLRALSAFLVDFVSIELDVPRCLLHADLTEDHLLLAGMGSRLHITALIDWADAEVAPPAYEWVALWFGLCQRDKLFFEAVMHGYDPTFCWNEPFRWRMLAYTCWHRFGAHIIEHLQQQDGETRMETLEDLLHYLWPPFA